LDKLTEKKNLNLNLRKNTSVHSSIILIALFFTLQLTLDLNLLGIDFSHVVQKEKAVNSKAKTFRYVVDFR